MGILFREQLLTFIGKYNVHIQNVSYQNILISHIFSNTIQNVLGFVFWFVFLFFLCGKKLFLKIVLIFSFIFSLETIECFTLLFFFIQSYNIKTPEFSV